MTGYGMSEFYLNEGFIWGISNYLHERYHRIVMNWQTSSWETVTIESRIIGGVGIGGLDIVIIINNRGVGIIGLE